MAEEKNFKVRWIKPGLTARQVYALPTSIPWPDSTPPPSLDDYFLNLSALLVATESEEVSASKWSKVAEMCGLCEQASELMENFGYSDALEILDEAESAHPCAFVHWQRCICHLELRHPEQALAAAYHATSMAPRCAVFWRVFGELCQERGMPDDAAAAFEKAFFGGERTPSVISGMRSSGLLVPNPAQQGEMLVSPAVARAILEVHIRSAEGRSQSLPRLRELARRSLESEATADVALEATECLVRSPEKTETDSALHAEALWASGRREQSILIANSLSCRSTVPASQLSRMVRKILPGKILELAKELCSSGRMTRAAAEELFATSDPNSINLMESFLSEHSSSPLVMALLADRLPRAGNRRRAISLASSASSSEMACLEALLLSAKVLLELGECEKACAAVSKVPESERGNWGQFILAESLWKLGHPEMCLAALSKVSADNDDALNQNVQMRTAQCKGFLHPLQEPASASPTRRLVRPILVSGPEWTSVIAPAGLPTSSYIRVQIGSQMPPSEYRVFEFSRTKGELELGHIVVSGSHNILTIAVDPDGRVFVGAKMNGSWVNVSAEE